jgi:hypothetical protein
MKQKSTHSAKRGGEDLNKDKAHLNSNLRTTHQSTAIEHCQTGKTAANTRMDGTPAWTDQYHICTKPDKKPWTNLPSFPLLYYRNAARSVPAVLQELPVGFYSITMRTL